MRFEPLPLERALGGVLGHNVVGADGRRLLRKGKALGAGDLEVLRQLGRRTVYVALLAPGDVGEDEAALRVTRAVVGAEVVRFAGPATGRVNVHATALGILRVDLARLAALNELDGTTLATLPRHAAVAPGRMLATTKILPYALPEDTVRAAERLGAEGPVVRLEPLPGRAVSLIVSGSAGARDRTTEGFATALAARLQPLGARLARTDFVALDEESGEGALAQVLRAQRDAGSELLVLAGETAIQDRHDLAPRALEAAGGTVTCYGAPVDPGNLLMLGELDSVPVLGAPGCARSPKRNIVDLVLPRLLAGDRMARRDIVELGHGGLLEDVPERPMPRSHL